MNETAPDTPEKKIPFKNLYLVSGYINGLNKSWMYIVTCLLLISGYAMFQSLIIPPLAEILVKHGYSLTEIANNTSLLFDARALGMDKNIVLILELGMFVFGFLGFYVGLRLLHRKSLTSVTTGYERFRYSRFFFAALVWGGLLILITLGEYFLFPGNMSFQMEQGENGSFFNFQGLAISVLVLLILMPVQTGFEELVFRGYLLQGLSQVFRNAYIPLIITSLLFGAAHMSNPEVKAHGWPVMLTYFVISALFMGLITLLDEGLELAFGIHFANNLVSTILVTSPNSVVKTYSIFDVHSENAYVEICVWLFMASVAFGLFRLRYGWKNFRLIIK